MKSIRPLKFTECELRHQEKLSNDRFSVQLQNEGRSPLRCARGELSENALIELAFSLPITTIKRGLGEVFLAKMAAVALDVFAVTVSVKVSEL